MQFEKNSIRCLRSVLCETKDHEETYELRLEDGMADIGEIIGCWGQVVVRGKEWRPGGISTNGGIIAWVLYKPEEGEQLCCASAWIPYQFKCDFDENERDGGIVVQPLLSSLDARMISSRKIMLCGDISVLCQAMVDSEITCFSPGAIADDIMLLQETFEPLLPKEMNEKAFMLDDAVTFPTSAEKIDKVVYYQLSPSVTDYKVMGDKIIFRGQSRLHVLYMDTDGQVHTWDEEFPFSQFAELGREYTDGSCANIIMAVTSAALEREENGYRLRAGLTGQFVIYDHEKITVVKDAYSPNRSVSVHTEDLVIPAVLDVQQRFVSGDCRIGDEYVDVVDSVLYPVHPRAYKDGESTTIAHSGVFRALCRSLDGELGFQSVQFNTEESVASDMTAKPMVTVSSATVPQGMTSGSAFVLSSELESKSLWIANKPINMVTELDVGDHTESLDERPGVVLRRAAGDTLWEIAKEYGSTVALIMDANQLQGEPDVDRMLLIPIL